MERCYRCMRGYIENGVCNHCRRRTAIHTQADSSKLVLQPGTQMFNGAITIGALLGKGGFGATYVADSAEDGVIALKEFLPVYMLAEGRDGNKLVVQPGKSEIFHKSLMAFEKEAELLSKLKHNNIVKVFFKAWENNTVYYGMELLEGADLAEFMLSRKGMPFGEKDAADFIEGMYPILDALTYLHRKNVFHRDISPSNIFLRNWTRERDRYNIKFDPCLIDFGAAFVARADYTKSVARVRTPLYSPYEQNLSTDKICAASDIYSLCATMYHVLTGVAPSRAVDRMTNDDQLAKPSEINPVLAPLDDVLLHGMALHIKDRIRCVEELQQGLQAAVAMLRGDAPVISGSPAIGGSPVIDASPAAPSYEKPKGAPPQPIPKDSAVKTLFSFLLDLLIPTALGALIPMMLELPMGFPAEGLYLAPVFGLMFLLNFTLLLTAKRTLGMLIFRMKRRGSVGRRILAALLRCIVPFALVDVLLCVFGAYNPALCSGPIADEAPVAELPKAESAESHFPPSHSEPKQLSSKPRYRLTVSFNGTNQSAGYTLCENKSYRVGRYDCEILIPENRRTVTVSKHHCDVEVKGGVLITDRSTNGCYVNGQRIDKNVTYNWGIDKKVTLGDAVTLSLEEIQA